MPKISFIIPYYNVPTPLLKECVESIFALSLKAEEREIIVVDDGSEESSVEALKPYGHHIIYIRQENGGLSAARNTGIAHATGEYIQFVDADDTLLPQAYDVCLTLLKDHQPDILLFRFTDKSEWQTTPDPSFRKGGEKKCPASLHSSLKKDSSFFTLHSSLNYLLHHNLRAAAWSYLFRKNILGDLRFTKGLLHEDEEFTPLLFLRASSVMETGLTAYYYRQREDSIIHRPDAAHIQKRLDDTERIIVHLNDVASTLSSEGKVALSRRVAQLTMDYLYNTMKLQPDALTERIERLRQICLYPLPVRNYTVKYLCFVSLANTRLGLKLLAAIL